MPIYEYLCPGCGAAFEKRVSFSQSDERQVCPHCGNRHARRQISLIGGISGASTGAASTGTGSAACAPSG